MRTLTDGDARELAALAADVVPCCSVCGYGCHCGFAVARKVLSLLPALDVKPPVVDTPRVASFACSRCSVHHELDGLAPGDVVELVNRLEVDSFDGTKTIRRWLEAGTLGSVLQWSQYGGPLTIRCDFGREPFGARERHRVSFAPCELRRRVP